MEFKHYSVLLNETIELLNVRPDGVYVDLTTGGGGHSLAIAERLGKGGRLICFDRDADALEAAKARLKDYADRTVFVRRNFGEAAEVISEMGVRADGVIADLGISSFQIDNIARGFSYASDSPLDMRMDASGGVTAADLVNAADERTLARIISEYGEEKFASRIARFICEERKRERIETAGRLTDIIKSAIPAAARRTGGNPAKRTFQALRIEVNDELGELKRLMGSFCDMLNVGGRIAVISFHSLEDRIVKQSFAELARTCTCPPDLPVCVCGTVPKVKVLTKKPVLPSERELEENKRSHSAKLRAAERI
ncbi:MAG: 16S rRNA (cytosine(1402)-N(4))-methyltransferase RsmH [Clostridia bacterium]|jgi:16S rRNA (cytosine1402-N4)-methyltransferase|nr:16S rRNA (cytosine(1402)-N(4))-methyltransferase RsmH [Clostridia bacterium]